MSFLCSSTSGLRVGGQRDFTSDPGNWDVCGPPWLNPEQRERQKGPVLKGGKGSCQTGIAPPFRHFPNTSQGPYSQLTLQPSHQSLRCLGSYGSREYASLIGLSNEPLHLPSVGGPGQRAEGPVSNSSSVLFGLLQLSQVLCLRRVVCAGPAIIGGAHSVVAAPVPLTQDPGQRIYLEV